MKDCVSKIICLGLAVVLAVCLSGCSKSSLPGFLSDLLPDSSGGAKRTGSGALTDADIEAFFSDDDFDDWFDTESELFGNMDAPSSASSEPPSAPASSAPGPVGTTSYRLPELPGTLSVSGQYNVFARGGSYTEEMCEDNYLTYDMVTSSLNDAETNMVMLILQKHESFASTRFRMMVTVKQDEESERVGSFMNLEPDYVQSLAVDLAESNDAIRAGNSYRAPNARYLCLEGDSELAYLTVVKGKWLLFAVTSSSVSFSVAPSAFLDLQEQTEAIVDSLQY